MKTRWFADIIRKREGLTFVYRSCGVVGTFVCEAVWDHSPMPVCSRWVRWEDKERTTLMILNSYVPERMRRLGLSTWTFEEMIKRLPSSARFIVTDKGTEFSEPWLVKMGFVRSATHGWIYTIKKPMLTSEQIALAEQTSLEIALADDRAEVAAVDLERRQPDEEAAIEQARAKGAY